MPILVRKCLENWKVMNPGFEVICLTDENLETYVKRPKPRNYPNLAAVVKSVWARDNVIYEQGGFWIDATVFLFKPLSSLFNLESSDFIGVSLLESGRPCDWFFSTPRHSFIIEKWCDELATILEMDPNRWCEQLQDEFPGVQFHGLPYYFNGWALWKVIKRHEKVLKNSNFQLVCNLKSAYSFIYDDFENFCESFPNSHLSSALDPVTFACTAANDDQLYLAQEFVPEIDKESVFKNLFQIPIDEFLEGKPEAFCAKFTAPCREVLEQIFCEDSSSVVHPESIVARCVPEFEELFKSPG